MRCRICYGRGESPLDILHHICTTLYILAARKLVKNFSLNLQELAQAPDYQFGGQITRQFFRGHSI